MTKQVHKSYLLILLLSLWAVSGRAQNPHVILDWAIMGGSSGFEFGFASATDNDHNVYASGAFSGTVDFDPGPGITLATADPHWYSNDVFITKFDAAGNFKWVRHFGGTRDDFGRAIKADKAGNIYVTGQCGDSVDFNPGGTGGITKGSGFLDIFVVKYNSNGDFQWAKRTRRLEQSSSGDNIGYGLCLDAKANVYITGQYTDTSDFDPGPGTFALNNIGTYSTDVFIWKLDSAGNFIWAKSMGSPGFGNEYGYDIAVNKGDIYATGIFQGVADFDPSPTGTANLTCAGSYDIYMAKYDTAGNYKWAHGYGGTGDDFGEGIAVDTSGNVYTTGYFSSSVDFDPGSGTATLNPVGGSDVYMNKYTTNGDLVWARSIGSGDYDYSSRIALDVRGNPYTIGYWEHPPGSSNTLDMDPGTGTDIAYSNGDDDIFIVKLDFNGNYKWGKNIGGTGTDIGKGIDVDADGSVYTEGYAQNTVDFDPNSGVYLLTSYGGWDFYIQKLICVDTSNVNMTIDTCSNSYVFYGQTYNASGIYAVSYPNINGCDSTFYLALTLNGAIIKPSINVNGNLLGTALQYHAYQWFKNGTAIPGATDSTYTVTENADYTVVVYNDKGCSDTATKYTVTNVGVNDLNFVKNDITIYPNPSSDIVKIACPIAVQATLTSLDGRIIRVINNATQVSLKELADGMYLLRLSDNNNNLLKVEKIIKASK